MSRDDMMADRAAEAVALARETAAQRNEVGALAGDALAGGAPPKWVALKMITAGRLIAAAARGEAVSR